MKTEKMKLEAFCKEHSLPTLQKWVDLEEEVTLVSVREALSDKLSDFTDLLEELAWPEGVAAVTEAMQLTDAEQQEAHALHSTIMLIVKDCLLAEIESTPEEDLALIKRILEALPVIAPDLKRLVKKTKEAYNGSRPASASISYLG